MEPVALGHLAVWKHSPNSTPRARVLHIHGISEHSGRHLPTIESLNSIGIEVVRFDLTGSGLSGGKRQYVNAFSDYVSDVAQVFNWMSRTLTPLPLYVMGHSLGGGIAIHFCAQYGKFLNGLILSAPGYKTGGTISPLTIMVGRILVHFFPRLRLHSTSSPGLSRDPQVVENYRKDPLASHFNTLKQGAEVLDAFKKIPELCQQITVPTIILHGTADSVILPQGSFEILQALKAADKELHYLPGVFHEPHLDLDKENFFSILTRWLEKKISQ